MQHHNSQPDNDPFSLDVKIAERAMIVVAAEQNSETAPLPR